MNIQFQRAVDRLVGVPLCALFSAIHKVSNTLFGQPSVAQAPQRILIILLSEMGSLVLAQPMFARLGEKYPAASIHVLMFAKNREVLDLLDVIPAENVITLDDSQLGGFVQDCLSALFRLRALKFDAVIDCELFSRVSSIFSYLSGAPTRVGFERHTQEGLYRGSFINRPVMYNPYRHLTLQFLTMVNALSSKSYPLGKDFPVVIPANPPQLQFAEGELEAKSKKLLSDFPTLHGKRLVLIYPSGGMLPIRAWPTESYITLSQQLLAEGYAIGVIGMPSDKDLGQEIIAACAHEQCVDLTGYTDSVRHLLALFHHAALLITNDGGPGQFAALTPIPSIVFFGPETPLLYRSLAENAYFFHQPLSCSPCLTAYNHRASPCDGDNQCLKQITPTQVLDKAHAMLTITP